MSNLQLKIQGILKSHGTLYNLLVKIFGPVFDTPLAQKTIQKILKNYSEKDVILNLGSGPAHYMNRKDIINIDLFPYQEVDIVADSGYLPIKDETADLIFNIAILEHVPEPQKVTGEMHRVLKQGGKLICYLPFIVPFHAAPDDFQRWTAPGVRRLFSSFQNVEISIGSGPTSGMLWVFQEWLAILFSFGSKTLHDIFFLAFMIITAPVKLLDLFMVKLPCAERIASGFYVIGEKSTKGAVDSKLTKNTNPRSRLSDIEILFWVGGDRPQVENSLHHTLSRLAEELPDHSVAFLLDGPEWEEVIHPFLSRFPNSRQISLPSATDQPQLLYSMELLKSNHPFVKLLWPGCEINVDGLSALREAAGEADLVYGDVSIEDEKEGDPPLPSRFLRQRSGRMIPAEPSHPVQYGWLQMMDCVPMHNCLVSREAIKTYGAFDPSPWLQELFWWDFTRRLSRNGKMAHHPSPDPGSRWSWRDYPFRHRLKGIGDQAIRYLGVPDRCFKNEETYASAGKEISSRFLQDLDPREGSDLVREAALWRASLKPDSESPALPPAGRTELPRAEVSVPEGKWPLKVTVLSGPYDPHSNQLCFYNYFERLSGRGLINWRAIVYETCLPSDLDENDLVIFSRPRYPEAIALMDYCRRNRIPTLLMIDDNWIAAGIEFPRYKSLFTPGCDAFEVFLYGLRHTDATIVYNELLEEDIRPYARRIFRMPVNVDMDHFSGSPRERKTFIAGFAGSPRFETAAFRALARFIRHQREASIFIMAHQVPEELVHIPSDRIRFIPYQYNYFGYARTVSSVQPDVLLAPLDRSRFSASKCPNKYLETAAIGSAGIYSRVPPYTDYVKDGETGLLVENEEEAWLDALELLYRKPDLRSRIVETAGSDVRQRFSTERLIPTFLRILQDVVSSAKTE